MKTIKINKISRLSVILLTVISACTVQENPSSGPISSQAISVVADTQEPGTKTTLSNVETQWASEDKIGLFSPQAKATADGTPEVNPVKNVAFTAKTPAKSSTFKGSMYWGDASSKHNFYAYYPYNSGYTGEQTTVPISLPSAQSQSVAGNTAHIGALDFMVATSLDVTPPGTVNFTFSHVFAMIEFNIVGSGQLTQINLIGAGPLACEGTINLSQTPGTNSYAITTTSTSDFVSVTLGTGASLSSTAVSVYMMLLPGAQSKNMEIALKIDGNWKILSKTPPTGGFSRGQKYVISLNSDSAGWSSTLTDSRDSNVYDLVVIGEQIWMAENLRATKYPNGTAIPTGHDNTAWSNLTTGAYAVYPYSQISGLESKEAVIAEYGCLYNWWAAMNGETTSDANPSGVQGICPAGWHLPSDAEWTKLTSYLGGVNFAGGKMKEIGTTHWASPDTEATNSSGFSALPGGFRRNTTGSFVAIGDYGYWWSSKESSTNNAWYRRLFSTIRSVERNYYSKVYGFSVRCVKDFSHSPILQ